MTKEELAAQLDGNECCDEISRELEKEACLNGLVVVFGQSDDLIEFRGAIRDEKGAYEGIEFKIGPQGLPENECHDPECPYFEKLLEDLHHSITANWCSESGYSWYIHGTMECAYFDIIEDDEKYCRGIVFSMESI